MIFISGGVRSGKSSFAEDLTTSMQGNYKYVATAKSTGSEMESRIRKHQEDRKNKNFTTIEKSINLNEIVSDLNENDIVLVECLTTLVANEMFDNNLSYDSVVTKVFDDLVSINDKVSELIIVSNDLYGDDINYENETLSYYNALTNISKNLVEVSNIVYEISYKIPIKRKG